MLAAIGVVYGDIGTSPLYTMREAFGQAGGLPLGPETVLGVLSLVFWALVIVVTLKYVILIMRADNQGDGGVLALVAQGRRMKVCIPICREINLEDGSAAPLRVLPVTEHILDRAPIVIPNGAIKGRTCS